MINTGGHMKTIVAAALLIGTAVAVQAQDGALSKRDVQALFPGTFAGNFDGYKLVIRADSDGSLQGKVADLYYDEGTWSLEGNRLCVSWDTWTEGETTCGEVVKDGSWLKASAGSGDLRLRRL